jgi:hypothetical protein
MKNVLFFLVVILFIIQFEFMNAQTSWQYSGNAFDSWTYYKPGKVSINFFDAGIPLTGINTPTLLVHGIYNNPNYHKPIIRLQSGDETAQSPYYFREARIEFWSAPYGTNYDWCVGQITSYNAAGELTVLDPSALPGSFRGGLKFFCSDGETFPIATDPNARIETMRIVAGKVGMGIFDDDLELPRATLDLRRSPWGLQQTGSDNNGKVFSVGDQSGIEHLEIFEDGQVRIGSGACVGSGQQTFTGIKLWVDGKVKIGDDMIDDQSDYYDTYNLSVDGVIVTKELVVTQFDWSDFVFDKNYKLKSIDEVQEFIIDNKHLPDIPKESELQASGLNISKMQAKLLQKIEELTLYVIELNNENKELKKRIELLEK